jgi:hypothetical protein
LAIVFKTFGFLAPKIIFKLFGFPIIWVGAPNEGCSRNVADALN